MLTKDLLRFSRKQGKIIPQFLNTQKEEFLTIATELYALYIPEMRPTRGELTEMTSSIINACNSQKVAAGLNKIILDHCKFSCPHEIDFPDMRHRLFEKGTKILNAPQALTYTQYKNELLQDEQIPPEICADIYADLPDNEILMETNSMTPERLLQRYNVALTQSLLLYADEIKLNISEKDPGKLRQFFKYLKFFKLLADIQEISPTHYKITISGPSSIFENGKKYGLQLATFFPAICNIAFWKLECKIKLPDFAFPHHLTLDQSYGLTPIYHQFSAYIPEEIRLFHNEFAKKQTDWQIIGNTPFLMTDDNDMIFPDLSFQHRDGTLFHVELFHHWHSAPLKRRLAWKIKHPEIPILFGIDRRLTKSNPLESNEIIDQSTFLFNDFPSVTRLHSLLEKNRTSQNLSATSNSSPTPPQTLF